MRLAISILSMGLLAGCSIDWTPGVLKPGAIAGNTSAICQALQSSMGTASYCTLAASYRSPSRFGSGSASDPHILCSPYELNAIGGTVSLLSRRYRLGADIDMSCISGNHTPIGTENDGFTGNFDGNNKEIRNWSHSDTSVFYKGLFTWMENCSVQDLTLTNFSLTASDYAGLLTGWTDGCTIRNVSASGTVSGGNSVGGLVGYTAGNDAFVSIRTSGTVTGTDYVGGIIGRNGFIVTQSSSSATVTGANFVGGLVGSGSHIQISSSSFTGSVTASGNTAGGLIGSTWGMIANSYSTGSVTSSGTTVGGLAGTTSNHIHNSFSSGSVSGTTTVGAIAGSVTGAGSSVVNSFSVSTVTGTGGSSANVGVLFGTIAGASTNNYYLAGAGCDADSATVGVQACNTTATGSVPAASDFHSALNEPLASWDFQDNATDGTNDFWEERTAAFPVAWYDDPAPFTAPFSGAGTEASPYLITSVADFNAVGMNPRLLDAHYRLEANLDFSGGIVQFGSEEAPFFGDFDGNGKTISNPTITKTTAFTGVFGLAYKGEIRDLTVTNATITGVTFVGALVGYTQGTVTNCHSSGVLTATYHAGGLVGLGEGTVTRSSSSVNILGTGSALGGLVGNNYGTISRSFATGNISNASTQVGGLAGMSSGTIENSYARGNVSTPTNFRSNYGGLVGESSVGAEIVNSFATGDVYSNGGATRNGPLVGTSNPAITNSYYLGTAVCDSGSAVGIQACNVRGTGAIADIADLYDVNTSPLDQWDFMTIWESDGASLPTLR